VIQALENVNAACGLVDAQAYAAKEALYVSLNNVSNNEFLNGH